MKRVFPILIATIMSAAAVLAQTPTGTIQGVVKDTSAAVVPGARVVIRNVATNEAKEFRTDSSGRYVQPFLIPGTYTVTAEADGFRPVRLDNIKLDVAQNRSVDVVLEIGAVQQEISVEAAPPPIDVNTSSVSQVIENKRIMDLPLNGRSAFSLALLTPGVLPGGGSTPVINGGRNTMSELQIDGITDLAPTDNLGVSERVYEPQVDAVEEFSVQINTLSAEYGRFTGGVINVATKSGTNKVHGTAYDYLRNSKLDANNFFANRANRGKGSFKRNQWGGTLGGPIYLPGLYDGRDKSFFFVGLEATNSRSRSVYTGTVPIDAWREGDFSSLRTSGGTPILIYDPQTVNEDPNKPGTFVRSPFAGNQIPASRIDPIARNLMKYYPAPNSAPTNANTNANNYTNAGSSPSDQYRMDTRVDHNWAPWWRMFARVSLGWRDNDGFNAFGNLATPSASGTGSRRDRSISLDQTLTLAPTLLANVRYGLSRYTNRATPFSDGFDMASVGFPEYLANLAAVQAKEYPNISITGFAGLGQPGWTRVQEATSVHSLTANVTKILSAHTIKAGGEYRKLFANLVKYGYPSGNYSFSPNWTQRDITKASGTEGYALASFLLGLPSGGSISHDPYPAMASSYAALFVQDDWRITSKLMLNLGLRWDVDVPRTERYNRLSYFDLNAPSPLAGKVPAAACPECGALRGAMFFTDPSHRTQAPTDWNNFGPRAGFAYAFTPKMALRGGYGIAFSPGGNQASGPTGNSGMDGYRSTTNFMSTNDSMRSIYATLSNPYPDGFLLPTGSSQGTSTRIGQSIYESVFDAWKTGYVQQWNMNVQRELPGSLTTEIGYIGSHGIGLVEGGGPSFSQLPASAMGLGSRLLDMVANPFYGVITDPTSPLSKEKIEYRRLIRPYPQYNGVSASNKPRAASIYHAMTVKVDKRFSRGMSFLLAYTAGKLIDDAGFQAMGDGNGKLDSYNRKLDRSVSGNDVPQRFVASYVYELPFGKNKAFLSNLARGLNMMVTGWQINGITTFQSGTPLSVSGAQNNTYIFSGQRPNSTGKSARITGERTIDEQMGRYFDTSVFTQPAAYTFGNLGRYLPDVRRPGTRATDLSVFKNSYFGTEGKYNLQFRAESFNAFNTTHLGGPNTNMADTSGFGTINGTSVGSRQVQMALKLLW